MIDYTHEVFRVGQEGEPTTHYYNINTLKTYSLSGELSNPRWMPNAFWQIRPIIVDLENK